MIDYINFPKVIEENFVKFLNKDLINSDRDESADLEQDLQKNLDLNADFGMDFEGLRDLEKLEKYVKARNGRPGSPKRYFTSLIVYQALIRYFQVLECEASSLDDMFTRKEILCILNSECCPIWNFRGDNSVASMVANDNGIESWDELKEGSAMEILLKKLANLTSLQNAILVDLCECIWRHQYDSIEEAFECRGISLAE